MLNSSLGQTAVFLEYKARRKGGSLVLSKEYLGKKDSKKVGRYNKKTKVGQGLSDPSSNSTKKLVGDSVRLVEAIVIDTSIKHLSKNQETPLQRLMFSGGGMS